MKETISLKKKENICSCKNWYMNIHRGLIHNSKNGNNPNVHQMMDGIFKMWCIHMVEYYLAIKRN